MTPRNMSAALSRGFVECLLVEQAATKLWIQGSMRRLYVHNINVHMSINIVGLLGSYCIG